MLRAPSGMSVGWGPGSSMKWIFVIGGFFSSSVVEQTGVPVGMSPSCALYP